MVFKKIVIMGICGFLLFGCKESNERQVIEELKMKNDSLNGIINELNQKYIFDSISIRDIPSHQNTYLRNTDVTGEIVIVGYNRNQKTNVILGDSIVYDPNIRLDNPDTLQIINGGFVYRKRLLDSLHLRGVIEFGNEHGKSHQVLYNTMIRANNTK